MPDFEIEVVFASRESQALKTIVVASGATVADAIAASGLLLAFPDQNPNELTVGIWGRVVEEDRALREGDRVELYRPLELDPREARRQLATVGRTMGMAEQD